MADRYRLPDILGGGEYEEHRRADGSTEAPIGTVAFLVEGCIVAVAVALLTKVEPPLPPEPPRGEVVLDVDGHAWQNAAALGVSTGGRHWWSEGRADEDWSGLQRYGPLTRLVPDPAAGVELPWRGGHPEAPFTVSFTVGQGGAALVSSPGPFVLDAPSARAMAGALLAAAGAAEAGAP